MKKLLSDADADVREHGIGREEAIGMLGRLQTTLHKYDTSRRGPNIKHIVLWAGTNDVLNFMSSAEDIIQGLVTLIEACGSHRLVRVYTLHATNLEAGSDRIKSILYSFFYWYIFFYTSHTFRSSITIITSPSTQRSGKLAQLFIRSPW